MDHNTFPDKDLKIDSAQFFKLMLENSQAAGVLLLDQNGTILDCSVGIQKSFGYAKEDILGKNFSIMFIPEDRLKNLPEIELINVLQKGSFMDNNYILHKEGSYIWANGESIIVKDQEGRIFIIKNIFDISQQKILENFLSASSEKLNRSEEDLMNKMEELARINNDLNTFVYTASHDLKAPVANIEALIASLYEELTEECKRKEDVKTIVSMINNSFDKFKTTLQDLTKVGKTQAEGEKANEEIPLAEILEETKVNLQQQIEESEVIFIEDISRAPALKFPRKNLKSIIHNLISNAIKYRSPERRPEIRLISERHNGHVLLKVTDNGLGIREEDKGKVFSMYERLHHHVEGTGVGMAIVARIVDNNGGRIQIESEVGKGSTFSIYLKEDI